jgi:hypothetical protein
MTVRADRGCRGWRVRGRTRSIPNSFSFRPRRVLTQTWSAASGSQLAWRGRAERTDPTERAMAASTFKSRQPPSRQATERVIARGTGRRNLENVKFDIDQKVVWLVSYPISESGGAVGLDGLLAPAGANTKVAQMTALPFPEPAVRFACSTSLPLRAHHHGEANHGEASVAIGGEATKGGWQSGVFKDQCGFSRTRPRGRGFPCGWEGERCL